MTRAKPASDRGSGREVTPGIDDADRALVEVLMLNPRLSSAALGRATGLSAAAAERRLRRLGQLGVLRGCRAVVCTERTGIPPDTADLFVAMSTPGDPATDGTVPGSAIRTVYRTAGRWSSVLHVEADEHEHRQLLHALSHPAFPGSYQVARIRRTYVKVHRGTGGGRVRSP
ncbi:AsnC family transcriptional regulator [Amycolatopsis pithecellobii]|nr:AsnC family transcriptional regulator [Amycolatopsis pithecellobii]